MSRIILLANHSPRDVSTWSGTPFSIYSALREAGAEVVSLHIGPFIRAANLANRLLKIVGVSFDYRFSNIFTAITAAYISARLAILPEGDLVAIACSNVLPHLKTNRRLIYISDATFSAVARLNPSFGSLPEWQLKRGDMNERLSIQRAFKILYSSEWAAASAAKDYQNDRDKIHVLPFGPNIPHEVITTASTVKKPATDPIRILFVSTDWALKDGDKALDICQHLIDAGLNVHLDTVGKTPENVRALPFVTDHGFLSKSSPLQLATLCELYAAAHFLLLPTTADAFGVVLIEAQAFGVIPLATDVGGTSAAVTDRRFLLSAGATAEQFSAAIQDGLKDFQALSEQRKEWYLNNAMWARWSALILRIAHDHALQPTLSSPLRVPSVGR